METTIANVNSAVRKEAAGERLPGYADEMRRLALFVDNEGHATLTREAMDYLKAKYRDGLDVSPPDPPDYDGPVRGLGDVVAKATKLAGIKPCTPCKKRQAALNRMFPWRAGDQPADKSPEEMER